MDSFSGEFKKQVTHPGHTVTVREVDIAAVLDSDKPLDPKDAARIRYVHPNYRRHRR